MTPTPPDPVTPTVTPEQVAVDMRDVTFGWVVLVGLFVAVLTVLWMITAAF